jgi:hypothetical protein
VNPTATLTELRELSRKLLDGLVRRRYESFGAYETDVNKLCEEFIALDDWLARGGVLPAKWAGAAKTEKEMYSVSKENSRAPRSP